VTSARPGLSDTAGRLRHLPLALFAVPIGLAGLGLAWREAVGGIGRPRDDR